MTQNTFAGERRNGPARGAGVWRPTPLTAPGAAVSSATARRMTDHPGSVAGTFGVTNTMGEEDDDVTESYVGAFGAHQQ